MKFNNERSLERALVRDFPGAKSLSEAFRQAKEKLQEKPSPIYELPPPKPSEVAETMQKAISYIEDQSKGFDLNSIDLKVRAELGAMDTTSIEGIRAWALAWKKVILTYQKR